MNKRFGDSRVFAPFSYTYLWSAVVYKIISTVSSLHSTLYTIRSRGRRKDEDPPTAAELKDVFKQVHRSHDIFILWKQATA